MSNEDKERCSPCRFRSSPNLVIVVNFLTLMLHAMYIETLVILLPYLLRAGSEPITAQAETTLYANQTEPSIFQRLSIKYRTEDAEADITRKISYILAFGSGIEMLVSVFTGKFVNLCGSRWPLTVGFGLNFVSMLGYGLFTDFRMILMFRGIGAVGDALTVVSTTALLSATFTDAAERNGAMNKANLGLSLGLKLGFPLAPLLTFLGGVRVPFFVLATLTAIVAIFAHLIKIPEIKTENDKPVFEWDSFLDTAFDPFLGLLFACIFTLYFAMGVFMTTGPNFVEFTLNGTYWQISIIFFLCLVFMDISQIIGGVFTKYQWAVNVTGLLIFTVGFTLYTECYEIWQVLGTEAAVKIGMGLFVTSMGALLTITTDSRHGGRYGLVFGIANCTTRLGIIIGSLYGGHFVYFTSFSINWLYRSAGVNAGVVALVSFITFLVTKNSVSGKKLEYYSF